MRVSFVSFIVHYSELMEKHYHILTPNWILRRARKETRMTRAELALRTGISIAEIEDLERGELDILDMPSSKLVALALALHISSDTLLGDCPPPWSL